MQSLETELVYRKEIVNHVMKAMHDGLFVINHANVIDFVNDSAVKLLGYSEESELVGHHISDIFAVDETFSLSAGHGPEGMNTTYEKTFFRFDGSSFIGSCIERLSKDADFMITKILVVRDITENKKSADVIAEYTRRLENTIKELDQFAYIVSHDLKAPLRAISNLSSWLEEDLGNSLSENNQATLATLRRRVRRMEALINGILEYSKIGREKMSRETVNVAELLAEVTELLAPPSHITINIGPGMPILHEPRVILFQVFSNLISNAVKFNDKQKGIVSVVVEEKPACYEFTIEDNGPGIPEVFHEKIFMIFQTLQARDKFESTGIGLTIVKRILTSRGGKIWLTSQPGKGSKFLFTWPK
jgi:PAS domain S-box-containing protein